MKTKIKLLFNDYRLFIDQDITIFGWVHFLRKAKKNTIIFIDLYDGTIQKYLPVVIEKENENDLNFEKFLDGCKIGVSLKLIGNIIECDDRKQDFEFKSKIYEIIGNIISDEEYPIQKTNMNKITSLRHIPHLRCRSIVSSSIMTIRSDLLNSIINFMNENDVKWLDPNIITNSDCEGGGEAFTITTLLNNNIRKLDNIDYETDFFCKNANLTVSSQLQLEGLACSLGDCFTMNKSFRAEKSKTYKHVAEFTHCEYESIFIELDDLLDFTEKFLKSSIENTCNRMSDVLNLIYDKNKLILENEFKQYKLLMKSDFKSINFKEISSDKLENMIYSSLNNNINSCRENVLKDISIKTVKNLNIGNEDVNNKTCLANLLSELDINIHNFLNNNDNHISVEKLLGYCNKKFKIIKFNDLLLEINNDIEINNLKLNKLELNDDLSSDHEKYIVNKYDNFVFVTHWPKKIKSFYMRSYREDETLVENFDLLAPVVGELFGGSMREEDYDKLLNEMNNRNMEISKLNWYLDLRKFGTVTHGGWGLGFDRLLLLITGVNSIKDVIPFPVSYQSLNY